MQEGEGNGKDAPSEAQDHERGGGKTRLRRDIVQTPNLIYPLGTTRRTTHIRQSQVTRQSPAVTHDHIRHRHGSASVRPPLRLPTIPFPVVSFAHASTQLRLRCCQRTCVALPIEADHQRFAGLRSESYERSRSEIP